ncbi:DUF2180 family protein [Streptomyces niveus]|uniref:DUF2180 family protein n=1 Tax=Streptomyces niveus TaxID=193462 RepID=UPI0039A78505
MKCYDCDTEARTDTSAIGVCDRCGLLTCQDHSHVVPAGVLVPNGLGRTLSPLPARRVVCHLPRRRDGPLTPCPLCLWTFERGRVKHGRSQRLAEEEGLA